MSTDLTPNGETMQSIAQMMDGLPGALSDRLCQVVNAGMAYVDEKRAESRRMFTEGDARALASLAF